MLLRHRQVCQQVPILKLNFRKCDYDGPVSFKNYKKLQGQVRFKEWLSKCYIKLNSSEKLNPISMKFAPEDSYAPTVVVIIV